MSNAENHSDRDMSNRVRSYIKENEPVAKTQIQSHFPSNGILTLRRLMDNDEVEYNTQFQIVTTDPQD